MHRSKLSDNISQRLVVKGSKVIRFTDLVEKLTTMLQVTCADAVGKRKE